MSKLILTRYLYDKDEVLLTFISTLLSKSSSIEECIYWIYEYHFSGFNAFDLLWKIYKDFYMIHNPKLEAYMYKKHILYNSGDIATIAYIVKSMHIKKHSAIVFLLRQYYHTHMIPTHIYNNKPSWCDNFNVLFHNLLLSIHSYHWKNVCYHLKNIIYKTNQNYYLIYKTLIYYFTSLQSKTVIKNESIERKWNKYKDNCDYHFMISFIMYMSLNEEHIVINKLFISPNQELINTIHETNSALSPDKFGNNQIYNTLRFRRKYCIHDLIGSFHLPRFSFKSYDEWSHDCQYKWEYYVSESPLWRERINKYGGVIDNINKTILFIDDDHQENFYEDFGYELDEQIPEIKYLSLIPIDKLSWKVWYTYIYNNEVPIISLDDDFQFIY